MLAIAQNPEPSASPLLFLPLLLLLGLALIPATIARNKGYSFALFYVLGILFFLIVLIVALAITDKRKPVPPTPPTPPLPPAP